MADLEGKVTALEKQMQDLGSKKFTFSKDKKFPKLTRDIDFSEWLQGMKSFVVSRFAEERDRVLFIFDHLEKEARAEVRFRLQLDKCSAEEVLQVLSDLYTPTDSLVKLQQQFYGRNQMAGESLQDYALALMEKLTQIVEKQPTLSKSREEMIKEKFAEGVSDVYLKRELRRVNVERASLKFWELRQLAVSWQDVPNASESEDSRATTLTQESSAVQPVSVESTKFTDMHQLLERQQKQIEGLLNEMKDLKDQQSKPRSSGPNTRSLTCYHCKRTGHKKADCFAYKRSLGHLNSRNPPAQ